MDGQTNAQERAQGSERLAPNAHKGVVINGVRKGMREKVQERAQVGSAPNAHEGVVINRAREGTREKVVISLFSRNKSDGIGFLLTAK